MASFDPHTLELTGCGPGQAFTKVAGHACSGANSPYFSVDGGVTNIDDFNQTFMFASGDASDWGIDLSHPCPGGVGHGGSGDVQDAFNCNNRSSDVTAGTPSWKAFEAIGYNGAAVPEPTMWALLISGFAFAGQVLRRQRRAFAA